MTARAHPQPAHAADRPLVSVVIPTHNYGRYVGQAIESALAQDYEPKQVIVADDGSTDDTAQVLGAYRNQAMILRLPHRGPGAARNTGMLAAQGSMIALLDADDLWLPGKLSKQVQAMMHHPEAGLCHSLTEPFDDQGRYEPWVPAQDELADGWCAERIFRVNSIATSTVLMRRAALPGRGMYEDMPMSQDYALWLDVLFTHPAVFIPQILARYRGHPGQITTNKRKRWPIYQGLSRLRVLDSHRLQIDPPLYENLRSLALDELRSSAYERYWRRDFAWASLGFGFLCQHGQRVPLKHRANAWVRTKLPWYKPPKLNEGDAVGPRFRRHDPTA